MIRAATAAGRFYPADPNRLRAAVRGYLDVGAGADPAVVGVVAPHAGYRYSGSTAGEAFARVPAEPGRWGRIVLAGPAHFVPLDGVAVPTAERYATPLGEVAVAGARRLADDHAAVVVAAEPHAREHSLEVELPFLQVLLGDVPVLPLAVGRGAPEMVADVLDMVWDEDTLVVVSTDLSHYLPYEAARRRDHATAAAITDRRADAVGARDACGAYALRGFLVAARRRGVAVRTVALRNSGDTAGRRDEVVGYGAFAATLA